MAKGMGPEMHEFSDGKRSAFRSILTGAVVGVVAAMGMALFAMIAAATYQGTGFFTPMYHIASVFVDPAAMMTSMEQAAAGDLFYFTPGAAALGMGMHLAVGAGYGAVFGALIHAVQLRGAVAVPVGLLYGLAVLLFSSFVLLPATAAVVGGGDPIRDMPTMVGWGTFTAEHALFGVVLGFWPALFRRERRGEAPSTASAEPRPLQPFPAVRNR